MRWRRGRKRRRRRRRRTAMLHEVQNMNIK